MAFNTTTLSAAAAQNDTSLLVASLTGVTAPNFQSGSGITYGFLEQEAVLVMSLIGTVGVNVKRGMLGTIQTAHPASTPITFGLPSDFATFAPAINAFIPQQPIEFTGFSAPVAGAATNVATGRFFHLTGTVAMVNLTAPTGVVEGGEITIVFDGSAAGLTWTAAGNIAVAGTATTAGSAVTFVFDLGSGKWHPSRLA